MIADRLVCFVLEGPWPFLARRPRLCELVSDSLDPYHKAALNSLNSLSCPEAIPGLDAR